MFFFPFKASRSIDLKSIALARDARLALNGNFTVHSLEILERLLVLTIKCSVCNNVFVTQTVMTAASNTLNLDIVLPAK